MAYNFNQLNVKDNLGVGTDTPRATLEVKGKIKLNESVAVGEFSSDGTLATASHQSVPTTQTVKTYVDTQISTTNAAFTSNINTQIATVNTALATKADKSGSSTQDFQVNNLQVQGNLEVTGTTTFRNIEQHQGDVELGNEDSDRTIIRGGLESSHPSGALQINSPVNITTTLTAIGNATLNNTFLGDVGHGATWAGFSHMSSVSQTSYALLQSNDGIYTLLNKKSGGGFMGFRIDNVDKMIIDDTGNVGIGTTAPSDRLDVAGITKTQKLALGDKWLLSGVGDAHSNDEWLRLFNNQSTDYHGGLAAGKLWSSTGTVQGSDIHLKRDINGIPQALEKLLQLRGVSYYWQDARKGTTPQLGLIAQEVETVFPELVEQGADGMKALNYTGLIPALVEALKEQQVTISLLTDRLNVLEAKQV